MNKRLIRLTESDLHKIVKESVNRVMNEEFSQNDFDALGKHKLGIEIREFTGLIKSLVNSYTPTGNEAFDHNMKELSYRYFNHLKPMIEGFLN